MMWYRRLKKGIFSIVMSLALVMVTPVLLLAQDGIPQEDPELPCDDASVYGECPLDTWTIVLIGAGLLLGMYIIHKQQQRQQTTNKVMN